MPRDTKIDKLDFISSFFSQKPGFVNIDWKFHNEKPNIFIEFNNRKLLLDAIDDALTIHPELPFNLINEAPLNTQNHNNPIYKLKSVPNNITQNHITRIFTYFESIIPL